MAYNAQVDNMLAFIGCVVLRGGRQEIEVTVYSYDEGEPKVSTKRRYIDPKTGEYKYDAGLGRLHFEEADMVARMQIAASDWIAENFEIDTQYDARGNEQAQAECLWNAGFGDAAPAEEAEVEPEPEPEPQVIHAPPPSPRVVKAAQTAAAVQAQIEAGIARDAKQPSVNTVVLPPKPPVRVKQEREVEPTPPPPPAVKSKPTVKATTKKPLASKSAR